MPRLTVADLPFRYQNQIAAQLNAPKTLRKVSHPEPQRVAAPALVSAATRKKESVGRIAVRFVGFRVRLLDADNHAGSVKHLLDGLREYGVIADDDLKTISLTTEQVKVATFKEERTEIELDLPD